MLVNTRLAAANLLNLLHVNLALLAIAEAMERRSGDRLPSEATLSRALSEFAESRLASRLHETLIARTIDGHLVEHILRDATAIKVREKQAPEAKVAKPKARSNKPGAAAQGREGEGAEPCWNCN